MKIFLPLLFICSVTDIVAQIPANVEPLINVEYAFRDMAKERNTRDAFLHFLADSVIMFKDGKPVNGRHLYEVKKVDSTLLWWSPDYSDMASSGNFGYNTGYWRYIKNRNDTTPSSIGHFATIWEKQTDGSWKATLDMGISYPGKPENFPLVFSKLLPIKNSNTLQSKDDFMKAENSFISLHNDPLKAYRTYLSADARILIDGNRPFLKKEQIDEFLKDKIDIISAYNPINALIASSNDLGCIYGLAKVKTMKDSIMMNKTASYIHIWKREKEGMKLVLELVSF